MDVSGADLSSSIRGAVLFGSDLRDSLGANLHARNFADAGEATARRAVGSVGAHHVLGDPGQARRRLTVGLAIKQLVAEASQLVPRRRSGAHAIEHTRPRVSLDRGG
jgi:hypothetical protein